MVCIFLLIFLCYAVAAIHVHCLFRLPYVWHLTSKQGFCAHLNNNPKAESQSQGHKLRYRALDWTVHLSLTLWPQQHLPGPCILILPSSVIVTHLTSLTSTLPSLPSIFKHKALLGGACVSEPADLKMSYLNILWQENLKMALRSMHISTVEDSVGEIGGKK